MRQQYKREGKVRGHKFPIFNFNSFILNNDNFTYHIWDNHYVYLATKTPSFGLDLVRLMGSQ